MNNKWYILIFLLILLFDGFLPFSTLADFGPIVNGEETYVEYVTLGWNSSFFSINFLTVVICAILSLVNGNKVGQKFGIIGLSVFLLVIGLIHYMLNSIGQHGGPFIPTFRLGYFLMITIDLLLIPICFILIEKRKQPIESDLFDQ